ncbi:MAG: signal recognition particle-docking protein FtsY [Spirochaetaceae bacterium]|jgi:fused signal recognition particle receptor|nr:signal recognition particle-docking protein FtsY [Spirochaetaceae bacterium]
MGIAGFRARIKNFFVHPGPIHEEFFDDLSDLLVEGDFGAAEAYRAVEKLRERCRKEKAAKPEEVRRVLAAILEDILRQGEAGRAGPEAFPEGGGPAVILLLGVNGVGKTTTAAKLASLYRRRNNRRPILAAADTFRAAAIDQLKIHGERLGVRVVAHKQGGDPAAVVYDALDAALAGGGDLIIADTAGRMHTKTALMEELKKIDRVVESKAADGRYCKWLVLDATTGRNALAQAEIFHEAVKLDGALLTKFDSTARGGVVFSLAEVLKLPLRYICDGEQYEDIRPFDPASYAKEFAGLD